MAGARKRRRFRLRRGKEGERIGDEERGGDALCIFPN